ncbi:MAG TPA: hypothetical protein VEF04_05645, partial [Blastocatellia bacterium]|nr:hypothetical protein [Blastocatellia bacterium]
MLRPTTIFRLLLSLLILLTVSVATFNSSLTANAAKAKERRLLYVATPGIRNYLEYGGHGLLVFDIDNGHR